MRWRRTEASDTDVAFSMRRSAAEDIAEVMASPPGTFRASLTAFLTGVIA